MQKIVAIPTYNEEKNIGKIVKESLKFADKVVVCDDGSTDNTIKNAEASGAVVLKHEKNFGKGAALQSLFEYAKNNSVDMMITIDGDGQFLTEEIPILIEPIIQNHADIVIGYRFESTSDMPSYRKLGNKVLDKMVNAASELPFRDTQSGFRSYSKKAIERININTKGFGADAEILINASTKELKIVERKVSVLYNTGEKTSTKHPISHSAGVITSLIEFIAIKHPLKWLGIPGLILMMIGIIELVVVVTIFNETRYFSIPTTLVTIGAFSTGLMLLLMSILLYAINATSRNHN